MIKQSYYVTKATVEVLNENNGSINKEVLSIGGSYKSTLDLSIALTRLYPKYEKVINVVKYETKEIILGMTEEDFFRYATTLDKEE